MNAEYDKFRVIAGMFASSWEDGFNGFFLVPVNGEWLKVIASNGMGWEHVSVSKRDNPNRVPNHDHLCRIKQLFWGDDVWVTHFYPPKSEYVNNHAGCLHLWRPTHQTMPTPPSELTGYKGKTPEDLKRMGSKVMADYLKANAK
jgi:hypothetical protein